MLVDKDYLPQAQGRGDAASIEQRKRREAETIFGRGAVSIASMECLAVYDDEWLALYVILVFVAFISGMFLGASISRNGRKERT
jgi:hypothetical protein